MILKPIDDPEAFVYASSGGGKSFSTKIKITDISVGQAAEPEHIYTDEEILFEYKNRIKLPVVKMWENKLFGDLLDLLPKEQKQFSHVRK